MLAWSTTNCAYSQVKRLITKCINRCASLFTILLVFGGNNSSLDITGTDNFDTKRGWLIILQSINTAGMYHRQNILSFIFRTETSAKEKSEIPLHKMFGDDSLWLTHFLTSL
mmetsp:Transcript_9241/g.15206  ORF Transcript_9241/g.15206 Transcript_9241/m.15206 type:complete len:112 (+) Transcript_9241:378-713(+)